MNIPDDPPTGAAGVAVAELDAAWSALARLPRAAPAETIRKACERVARAQRAVWRATYCTECGADVGHDCNAQCPEAPATAEDIAEYYGQRP